MLNELVQVQIKQILQQIQSKADGKTEVDQQRISYLQMEPIDIIRDLVEMCREICQGLLIFTFLDDEYLE